ncbi:MAG: pyridoxamine 5'-phosphate oxidase family protein [Mycobacterium sp.]
MTTDIQRLVRQEGLGFVATVRPDGSPALSPKGTLSVVDEEHLAFVHLASPHTVANLLHDPRLEVNVVDPILRKGYRFVGTGQVFTGGPDYERLMDWFTGQRGTDYRARAHGIVLITVTAVEPLISPAYDDGSSEEQIAAPWRDRYRTR